MEQEVLIQVTNSSPYKTSMKIHSYKTTKWKSRSSEELEALSLNSLRVLKKELETIAQEASSELVGLLQERQSLQEEVDIRSITIEQLLKFAERRQVQLGEPLAIQMSVVRNHQEANAESGLG